jgi:hypothetical protein
MTALLALGKSLETSAFPEGSVSAELLSTVRITHDYQDVCYRELLPLLSEIGQHDLVKIIEAKSADYHRYKKWSREEDWKGTIKRFDRERMGAGTYHLYAFLRRNYLRLLASR